MLSSEFAYIKKHALLPYSFDQRFSLFFRFEIITLDVGFYVVSIVYFTILHILSPVEGVFSIDEVDTFSTFVSHILFGVSFYLKITLFSKVASIFHENDHSSTGMKPWIKVRGMGFEPTDPCRTGS